MTGKQWVESKACRELLVKVQRYYAPEMQVKQHVAVVKNSRGIRFRVFETGDPKFYLFSTIGPDGTEGGLQFPVRKADLRIDIRRALYHGYGNSL